jgi:hypothetical protein
MVSCTLLSINITANCFDCKHNLSCTKSFLDEKGKPLRPDECEEKKKKDEEEK